jgi:hypothetical protein
MSDGLAAFQTIADVHGIALSEQEAVHRIHNYLTSRRSNSVPRFGEEKSGSYSLPIMLL